MKTKEIILGVTASIAIYKACDLLRRLQADGFCVTIVMTKEAQELIRPILFQELSGNKVYGELFGDTGSYTIEHVALAERADLILIAPATANIIGKLASGICDDLLTCVVCASRAKVLLAPAMNENMYRNKIVQANIKKLKTLGYRFVGPTKGQLACGKLGIGCLSETEEIVRAVKSFI